MKPGPPNSKNKNSRTRLNTQTTEHVSLFYLFIFQLGFHDWTPINWHCIVTVPAINISKARPSSSASISTCKHISNVKDNHMTCHMLVYYILTYYSTPTDLSARTNGNLNRTFIKFIKFYFLPGTIFMCLGAMLIPAAEHGLLTIRSWIECILYIPDTLCMTPVTMQAATCSFHTPKNPILAAVMIQRIHTITQDTAEFCIPEKVVNQNIIRRTSSTIIFDHD